MWLDALHIDGTFICNIGDMLMRWTNDTYVSTPHRVARPARERYSVVYFADPKPDAWVTALPGCVPAGEAGAYLASRLDATYDHRKGAVAAD
jgi:isopenicillin N synthase-like dioxygenase